MLNRILKIQAVFLLIIFLFSNTVSNVWGGEDYIIGPQDVLEITVWDNDDLFSKAAVSLEGFINYHLIGKIKASGLTAPELADKIAELLADGYIINPQVTLEVVEYKSKKIFIIGEATKPGTYYLTKKTTLVEALSMAGGPTKDADREIILVRPKKTNEGGDPVSPNQAEEGGQFKVDLRSALEGDLSQNIYIQDGDSIFIPKVKSFFIMGEVKHPGQYNLEKGTTVLKAISMAGGTTEKAAVNRTKIVRIIDGKEVKTKVKMDAPVQPDDIIVVPESFF